MSYTEQEQRDFVQSLEDRALDACVVHALGFKTRTEGNIAVALMPDGSTAFLVGDSEGSLLRIA